MAYNVLQIERDCTPRAQSRRFDDAQKIYENRKRFMSKETFNAIRRGLYPGSRRNISDEKLAEAFDAFMSLEKHCSPRRTSRPTSVLSLPPWRSGTRCAR